MTRIGYFAVIVTGLGLIGGSIVGLAVGTSVRSGFATAQDLFLVSRHYLSIDPARLRDVHFTEDTLAVDLAD